jgi:hypothetical protein
MKNFCGEQEIDRFQGDLPLESGGSGFSLLHLMMPIISSDFTP